MRYTEDEDNLSLEQLLLEGSNDAGHGGDSGDGGGSCSCYIEIELMTYTHFAASFHDQSNL